MGSHIYSIVVGPIGCRPYNCFSPPSSSSPSPPSPSLSTPSPSSSFINKLSSYSVSSRSPLSFVSFPSHHFSIYGCQSRRLRQLRGRRRLRQSQREPLPIKRGFSFSFLFMYSLFFVGFLSRLTLSEAENVPVKANLSKIDDTTTTTSNARPTNTSSLSSS